MTAQTSSERPRRVLGDRPGWKDGNRYLWLLGVIIPTMVFGAWGLHTWTGSPVAWWLGPFVVYGLFGLLDLVIGGDPNNAPEEMVPFLEEDRWYRWVTYLYLPVQYACLFGSFWMLTHLDLGPGEKLGLMVTQGMITGISITVAHELGHKRPSVERWLARICLAPTAYGHFYVEHNRGHHVRVSTPEDPASSRLGENLWAFMPRTVVGGIRSAWNLEATRLRRRGRRVLSWRNDVLNAWLMSVVLAVVIGVVFGPTAVAWFLFQAAFGSLIMFEAVNYLEHYGLNRQKLPSGRYEQVRPEHSWNNNNRVTNLMLFHLQRHSDHHANPTRRYQALRDFPDAPTLPTGYAGMLVLAYFPPLWRAVMDHRVIEHYDGDVTRANILPRRRAHVLAKYGTPEREAV
jgi:alkane 1-monooxygenase